MAAGATGLSDTCELTGVDGARVAAVRAALPPAEVIDELSEIFGLLADAGRVRLLTGLLEAGELCVCDLAAVAGLGESATSHALRLLRAHRVVTSRRDGRRTRYRLTDGHVRLLLDVALAHLAHDDG